MELLLLPSDLQYRITFYLVRDELVKVVDAAAATLSLRQRVARGSRLVRHLHECYEELVEHFCHAEFRDRLGHLYPAYAIENA